MGTFVSSVGEKTFELTESLLSIRFSSYTEAMAWLTSVEVGVTPKPTEAPPAEPKAKAPKAAPVVAVTAEVTVTPPPADVAPLPQLPFDDEIDLSDAAPVAAPAAVLAPAIAAPAAQPAPSQPAAAASEPAPDASAPKRRGRPPGSKNKANGDDADPNATEPAAAPKPVVTAPAATPAPVVVPEPAAAKPAPIPAPASAPAPVVSAAVTRKTIMVGTVGWAVDIATTNMGFTTQCAQLPDLKGQGDTEKEALQDIRQVIASYMRTNLSTEVSIDAEAPVQVVKAAQPVATPAPVVTVELDLASGPQLELPKEVMEAKTPSMAVYHMVSHFVNEDVDTSEETIVKEILGNWARIPMTREKAPMTEDKLLGVVKDYRQRIIAAIEAQLNA